MTVPAAHSERIGEILVRDGLITREQLQHALLEQKKTKEKLGAILVRLGLITERTEAKYRATGIMWGDRFGAGTDTDVAASLRGN